MQMKQLKFIFIILIQFALASSCGFSKKENKMATKELSFKIKEKLISWKLNTDVALKNEAGKIKIEIVFKGKSKNSFFLDKESNNMIIAMLDYTFYDELNNTNEINYKLGFEGYPDVLQMTITKEKLTENYVYFNNTPIFYDFVEFAFINMGYINVLRATQLIEYLNKNYSEIFNYNGSFWNLLYDYSKACKSPEKNLKGIYNFVWFAGSTSDPANPREDDINQDVFKYYLKSCNLKPELLSMDALELMKYLDAKY